MNQDTLARIMQAPWMALWECDGEVIAEAGECKMCGGGGSGGGRCGCSGVETHLSPGALVIEPAERCSVCMYVDGDGRADWPGCDACENGYLLPAPGTVGCGKWLIFIHPDPAPRLCRAGDATADEWREFLGADAVPFAGSGGKMVCVYRASKVEDPQ